MSATVIDGKQLAADMRADIARQVEELREKNNVVPGLGVMLIGADPASASYVTAKEKACEEAGIFSLDVRLPVETTQAEA
ncbi:MAG: tetrahydrofolate dehydrogenase/cyclohydrolase catalytic domain-containing protein, partial [Kiritimatiellae bacterium]|nr:tetrahydrofolate dehydrogenase/cyclohydrolase catalytic domain-containing protein [Kiritimatiellia bacterium]